MHFFGANSLTPKEIIHATITDKERVTGTANTDLNEVNTHHISLDCSQIPFREIF
jgi:hypothetical protein